MSKEYKCVECGKRFDSKTVDHSSAFWKRSDGHRYGHNEYCSVECVGHADCNWRTSNRFVAEKNQDENDMDNFSPSVAADSIDISIPADTAMKVLRLVADGRIDSTDAKILCAMAEWPKPSMREIASSVGIDASNVTRRTQRIKALVVITLRDNEE